ncbi:MAG: STAS domain-containing protein [Bacillus sp. (in: firmicutes)]
MTGFVKALAIIYIFLDGANKKVYPVSGQLFFASVSDFVNSFDFRELNVSEIDLDLTQAHLWDDSTVDAIDKIVTKYQ